MSIFGIEYLNLYMLALLLFSIPFIMISAIRMWKIILASSNASDRNGDKPIGNPEFRKEAKKAAFWMIIFFGAIFIMEMNSSWGDE